MKTISITGAVTEAADPRDGMFAPRKKFGRTVQRQRDGMHFYVQAADGKTDHAFISMKELWAQVEKCCPGFCVPPKAPVPLKKI